MKEYFGVLPMFQRDCSKGLKVEWREVRVKRQAGASAARDNSLDFILKTARSHQRALIWEVVCVLGMSLWKRCEERIREGQEWSG